MVHRFMKNRLLLLSIGLLLILASTIFLTRFKLTHGSTIAAQTSGDHYDIVVVGAGPGGIAASIQAARMGKRVALLEPTDWIGGQMTAAGVGTMDEGSVSARKSGLYKDFVTRVRAYYASKHKSVDTCYYETDSLCVDPQVGQLILRQMLQQAGPNLHVFTNTNVTAVSRQGTVVTGVVASGKTISSKVVIDADEYGDILALSGAAYRLGTGTSGSPNSASCVQSITHTAVMKYYPGGVPASLRFKSPPPGYTPAVANSFAAYLKKNGEDNSTTKALRNLSFKSYAGFRGFPDLANPQNYNVEQKDGHVITRTSLNLGNDFPLDGNLSTKYISDPEYRAEATCRAKLLTVQLMYYIQHDLGETNWSVADDEGYNTPYNRAHRCPNLAGYESFEDQMSVEAYTREGRRLIGENTLTGNELVNAWRDPVHAQRYTNSIAVGYYPMDLHDCHAPLETAFDSPDDLKQKFTGGAFEVPLGALIPQRVDGLLAAEKNISSSRQANGAIREQPISMDVGQAAGALAALAVQQGRQPRAVPYQDVQRALVTAGVVTRVP